MIANGPENLTKILLLEIIANCISSWILQGHYNNNNECYFTMAMFGNSNSIASRKEDLAAYIPLNILCL